MARGTLLVQLEDGPVRANFGPSHPLNRNGSLCPSHFLSLMFSFTPGVGYDLNLIAKAFVSKISGPTFFASDSLPSTNSIYDDFPTYISVSVIVFTIFYDLLIAVRFPGSLRRILKCISSPFDNFLQVEDLEEYTSSKPVKLTPARWKLLLLVSLPFLQVLLKISFLSYHAVSGNSGEALRCAIVAFAWVSRYMYNIPNV